MTIPYISYHDDGRGVGNGLQDCGTRTCCQSTVQTVNCTVFLYYFLLIRGVRCTGKSKESDPASVCPFVRKSFFHGPLSPTKQVNNRLDWRQPHIWYLLHTHLFADVGLQRILFVVEDGQLERIFLAANRFYNRQCQGNQQGC